MKKMIIAFDLHGTLLDINWNISGNLLPELIKLLDELSTFADFFIISGNELAFVEKHLPAELFKRITGFVLETGSIIYLPPPRNMSKCENSHHIYGGGRVGKYLCNGKTRDYVSELKEYLLNKNYPFVKYFGQRESSISLFTKDESGGEEPLDFYDIVQNDLKQHKLADEFYITWSNVALDIIPVGISKWSALKMIVDNTTLVVPELASVLSEGGQSFCPPHRIAELRSACGFPNSEFRIPNSTGGGIIISFVDSYNDKEIALNSTYTFLPSNASKDLIKHIRNNNNLVLPLSKFHFIKNTTYITKDSYTSGVIEGLRYIKEKIVSTEYFLSEKTNENRKPEWTPENAGTEFASHIMPAVSPPIVVAEVGSSIVDKDLCNKPLQFRTPNSELRTPLTLNEYKEGILAQDKTILARAITLIESNAEKHFDLAQELIKEILPYTSNSIRLGITGIPGAGKSTFIETFGLFLIENKKRPAVLAIDPSSTITKGSILGDKTRMEILSRSDNAFIRPTPSSGNLGGVARKTRETMLLCEAAGFDVIMIETVGVGQSEVSVHSMVDFFLLILIAGAGDELQGIKKGVIELADAILINKADGKNITNAEATKAQYNNALHYLADATPGWKTQAYTCSAIENTGIDNIWNVINDFVAFTKKNKLFENRRQNQTKAWFEAMLNQEILNSFYNREFIKDNLQLIINQILNNEITPVVAVKQILSVGNAFIRSEKK